MRDHLVKHGDRIPDIESRIIETQVPCVRFDDLCKKHDFQDFDFLHIDTEGYDYEILKTIDLERYQPLAILYEHKHLGEQDRNAALQLLHGLGYSSLSIFEDTLAVKRHILENCAGVRRIWRRCLNYAGHEYPVTHAIAAEPMT